VAARNTKNPAVFIDRDGTLIREKNYLRRVKDIQLIKGSVEALQLLRGAGFKLILITNQSGIGRGYFTEKKLLQIHDSFQKLLTKKGIPLDAIYYCPHHPEAGCDCRKPNLGMIKRACREHRLDPKRSYSIGDHSGDFLIGQRMGGKGIFLLTGHGRKEMAKIERSEGRLAPDFIARNMVAAAKYIVAQKNGSNSRPSPASRTAG
jgi:histidinol-phosphate phosphatase family protein